MATVSTTPRASFSIFRDEPSPPQPKSQTRRQSISSTPTSPITNRVVTTCTNEKENVDPLTGQPPSIEQKLAKKRKTGGVLAAKIVLSTKSLKETQPEPKKRRIVSKGKTRAEKEKKVLSSRKERSTRVRKATDLPRVEEEATEEVEDKERVAQALVDARCYELTVMPLADVSEAYSPLVGPEDEIDGEEKGAQKPCSKSTPPRPQSPPLPAEKPEPSTPVRALVSSTSFSTPERKRIYSAFTFSSPSPASARYAANSRASSVDRFSDPQFDSTFGCAL